MVRLIILFCPADESSWLSDEERDALNDYYEAQYDTEIEDDVPSFQHAKRQIEACVRRFMTNERSRLVDQRCRITIAPFDPDRRDTRPYTGLYVVNDTHYTQQLLSEMAWMQVMKNTRSHDSCVVARVYVCSNYSDDEHRRVAVLKAAMFRPVDPAPFSMHSLAGHQELLQQIMQYGVPYRHRGQGASLPS